MSGFEIGALSVFIILVLVYLGLYVPIVLALVSFIGVWVISGQFDLAVILLRHAAAKSVESFVFGAIPMFVLMGLLVSVSDLGRDAYLVAAYVFRKVRGGLGIATIWASAIFSAVTGVSIASAAVFARISVPEMLQFGHTPRFAVGVVAGSSVLGMLIPPSILMIVYALLAEQSVGHLFIAGIIPGIVLASAYCVLILVMAYFRPNYVGGEGARDLRGTVSSDTRAETRNEAREMTIVEAVIKIAPIALLIAIVLGGIYGGVYTPTEAGAAGALGALIIALVRRKLTLRNSWDVLIETGQVNASILFLITSASMYSRMLGMSGLPGELAAWVVGMDAGFYFLIAVYVMVLLVLGTILDSISIILITVPLFLIIMQPFDVNLVWFGIVTIIGVEIGLLTPPLGISCFIIKSALADYNIPLIDIFVGAAPFALTMLAVLILVIAVPPLALLLL